MLAESKSDEDLDRLENVEELLTAAAQFDEAAGEEGGLERFLEQASLVNDTGAWEETADKVSLMTLHAAKGLEFPEVFIVAAEERLLPHERSLADPMSLEEERRLFFVGITRAEERLQISYTRMRDFRGFTAPAVPSSFLMELPRDEMELEIDAPRVEQFSFDDDADAYEDDFLDDLYDEPEEDYDQRSPEEKNRLVTAESLLDEEPVHAESDGPVSLDAFRLGMRVRHPEYGLGKIVALSGSDDARTATVNFAGPAGQRKFRLLYSPLRPVE
jgi:DNA helicase II / ATP-dependent DNA helicase PcrA